MTGSLPLAAGSLSMISNATSGMWKSAEIPKKFRFKC